MIQQIPLFSIEPIKQETPLGQIEIFNENCLETMQRLGKSTANIILTSPPIIQIKRQGKIGHLTTQMLRTVSMIMCGMMAMLTI